MKINKIFAKNYKGYLDLELELSDFNIVIGGNGSGKSSLLKLLPLVINSMRCDDSLIINLNTLDLDIGGKFSDIVYGRSDLKPLTLGAEFILSENKISFLTTLNFYKEKSRAYVTNFEVILNSELVYHVTINLDIDDGLHYIDVINNYTKEINFSGLIPDFSYLPENISTLFSEIISNLSMNNISYIGPFRENLNRVYSYKRTSSNIVGFKGELAPFVLFNENKLSKGSLLNNINDWVSDNLGGKNISIIENDVGFSIETSCGELSSNIKDDGYGFSQSFPLVVSKFSSNLERKLAIEIVEQPELHLHPAISGAIADLYLIGIDDSLVIMETHSEEILLRLRRRIAENPELVDKCKAIFTSRDDKSCSVEYINFDKEGGVDWWPKGIFEEDFQEVIKIKEAVNANSTN
ncbi:TPA: AAA family ATPase [Vibrio parahaemolyticus]